VLRQRGAQVRVPVHRRVVRVAHVQVRVAAKKNRTSPFRGRMTNKNGRGSKVIAIGPGPW
jgi:hypothetical protein